MSQRPPCDRCGSTNFEEENGIIVCDQGHHQEGGALIGEDEADFFAARKTSRKKVEHKKEKVSRVYRGSKGFRLFLKAWQFILWKQCHALVQFHGLPSHLWDVVRGLWALRLSQLAPRTEDHVELKEGNSLTPKDDTSDPDIEHGNARPATNSQSFTKDGNNPKLWETIASVYLGILILRQPVSLATMYDLIRQEEVCYIRAIRQIPRDMRERLAPEYHHVLDTTVIPQPEDLQLAVWRTAHTYCSNFEMILPPLNWSMMLLQIIRKLSLPLEVFTAAKHLASLVDFRFKYDFQTNRRRTAVSWPEAQLGALVIVTTKLLFPFDSDVVTRRPSALSEPASLKVDWKAWLEGRDKQEENISVKNDIGTQKAIELIDRDIFDMTEQQIDSYMDWYQIHFTTEDNKAEINTRRQILDLFPLNELPLRDRTYTNLKPQEEARIFHQLQMNQSRLEPISVTFDESSSSVGHEKVLPGQEYQQYSSLEEMSPVALAFHHETAASTCLDIQTLLRAVRQTERLLFLAQTERRRVEMFNDIQGIDLDS